MNTQALSHDEWLAARREGVGASEVPALLGVDPSRSAFSLWAEKTGRVEPFEPTREMYWGVKIEPVLAEAYAERFGRKLVDLGRTTIVRGEHPHLFATLDRIIVDNGDGRGDGVLECKNVDDHLTPVWNEAPPLKVQVQVQSQVACADFKWGVAGALIGGNDDRFIEIERNTPLIGVIYEAVDDFMKCLRDDVPPDVDASSATRDAIRSMFKEAEGREIDLPPEAAPILADLERAKAERKRWEQAEQLADNRLRVLIGDASVANIADRTLTLRTAKKASYVVAAQEYRMLLVKKPKKGKASR